MTAGFSPFLISLGMVAGVFVARWTVPVALKGTGYVLMDLREKPHLIVWAILAGMLWAVANTLTVFAVRNVGLSIAFPLWNINSLVGLFWGWLLFNELRGSGWGRVVGGAVAIVGGACLLAYATAQHTNTLPGGAALGIVAALSAGLLLGTMYIPYRKAYISGMNPLSFVTVFTFGELATVCSLAVVFDGGLHNVMAELVRARPALFWLFLGGFCWVVGDLFQNYAAKYIGIARGIPLSNTNQLWGLAWGVLVFGELAGQGVTAHVLVFAGSVIMIAGRRSDLFGGGIRIRAVLLESGHGAGVCPLRSRLRSASRRACSAKIRWPARSRLALVGIGDRGRRGRASSCGWPSAPSIRPSR